MEENRNLIETDFYTETPDYKNLLIEMINEIEDCGTLEYLHTFIKLFIEKWG